MLLSAEWAPAFAGATDHRSTTNHSLFRTTDESTIESTSPLRTLRLASLAGALLLVLPVPPRARRDAGGRRGGERSLPGGEPHEDRRRRQLARRMAARRRKKRPPGRRGGGERAHPYGDELLAAFGRLLPLGRVLVGARGPAAARHLRQVRAREPQVAALPWRGSGRDSVRERRVDARVFHPTERPGEESGFDLLRRTGLVQGRALVHDRARRRAARHRGAHGRRAGPGRHPAAPRRPDALRL